MTIVRDLLEDQTEYRRFDPPRGVYEYGFDQGGLIEDATSPSGFLLPWSAIDAHAESFTHAKPCEFVVRGEYRRNRQRWPDLSMNPEWLRSQGFTLGSTGWSR